MRRGSANTFFVFEETEILKSDSTTRSHRVEIDFLLLFIFWQKEIEFCRSHKSYIFIRHRKVQVDWKTPTLIEGFLFFPFSLFVFSFNRNLDGCRLQFELLKYFFYII